MSHSPIGQGIMFTKILPVIFPKFGPVKHSCYQKSVGPTRPKSHLSTCCVMTPVSWDRSTAFQHVKHLSTLDLALHTQTAHTSNKKIFLLLENFFIVPPGTWKCYQATTNIIPYFESINELSLMGYSAELLIRVGFMHTI